MTIEEQIERLTGIVASLAATVVHHDDQIGKLITIAEKQSEQMARLEKRWEAYLNTIRPQ